MARESLGKHSPAKLKVFAEQLKDYAEILESAAIHMGQLGLTEIEATHATAIDTGMRSVSGFCSAVQEAVRSPEKPKSKPKKRVRQSDTGAGK